MRCKETWRPGQGVHAWNGYSLAHPLPRWQSLEAGGFPASRITETGKMIDPTTAAG